MLTTFNDVPDLLKKVITGDKLWVYSYDIETKAQSSLWKLPEEPRPVKILLTVFFNCKREVDHEFFAQGRTVNKVYHLKVMCRLREAIRQKGTKLWKTQS